MSRIVFVGDPHFTGQAPSSRKETNEQYRELLLGKIRDIREICNQFEAKTVIFLGDLFNNNSSISNYFETELWKELLDFKSSNISLYTIIGNHDMSFQNETEFKGTYLYKAFLAGIINPLTELQIDDIIITGFDYHKDFKPVKDNSKYNIFVGHCFYENSMFGGIGNENLTESDCFDLGYDSYVLGHDHQHYEIMLLNNSITIVRPGSLTRGTSKTCNLYRPVVVDIFDTSIKDWREFELNVKPGTEIFKEKVILTKGMDFDLEKLLENFNSSKSNNIYEILREQEVIGREKLGKDYSKIVQLITNYCESVGIYDIREEKL